MKAFETREAWLLAATAILRKSLFKQHSAEVPTVRVSVGFPGGSRVSSLKAIGQCWAASASNDGIPQVFVSPVLDNPVRALDVLTHELVHACTPGAGHKGPFRKLALAVGLTGKMTATVAGPELTERLNAISQELGPYPHAGLNPAAGIKKQTTRMLKLECACGFVCRASRKAIDDFGTPICGACGERLNEVKS